MLRVLLAKDLRRAWRNPLPWLINLIVPLAMTALIGLVFGGKSDNGALGRIRFAVVDEDKSFVGDFLRRAATNEKATKNFEAVFLERDEALRQINAGKISAVVIIPTNFTRNYLTASQPVSLELIKNPAESIHPAVIEELLGAAVTALNALSRNFLSDYPAWKAVLDGDADSHQASRLFERAGDKLKAAKATLYPPLVTYERGKKADAAESKGGKPKADDASFIFAYMLVGMSAMFLLFLGNNAMTDLHRELRKRTFERYQTMHEQVWPFIVSKVVFTVVVLLICSAAMLGGGGLIFRVHWQHPLPLLALTLGYAGFVAALFAVLVALIPDERRAGALNTMVGMGLGMAGGCAFPRQQLPAFLREHVTPLMPTDWFVETLRNLQSGGAGVEWRFVLLKTLMVSAVLIGLAAMLFRRRFKTGLRA
jgi:ABC-type multidrug transport system permease subunit